MKNFRLQGSPALMVGGIALLVGLVLLAVSSVQFYNERRFAREGRATQGTVLTKAITTPVPTKRAGEARTERYEVTYRFSVEGETLEGRDELTRDRWEQLTEGGPVEVLYLSTSPSSNRLSGPRPWILWLGLFGLVFTATGAAITMRAVRGARAEARLQLHGVSTKGVVKDLRVGPFRINDEAQWRLQYEYEDFQGHRHVNTFDLSEEGAQHWKVGDVGLVRYDQAKPTEAVWLGKEPPQPLGPARVE